MKFMEKRWRASKSERPRSPAGFKLFWITTPCPFCDVKSMDLEKVYEALNWKPCHGRRFDVTHSALYAELPLLTLSEIFPTRALGSMGLFRGNLIIGRVATPLRSCPFAFRSNWFRLILVRRSWPW